MANDIGGYNFGDVAADLEKEARRLANMISNGIAKAYVTSPVVYHRTEMLQSSPTVKGAAKVTKNSISIDIVFYKKDIMHKAKFGSSKGKNVNTLKLLNWGYQVNPNVWFADIENFGWRNGAHFLENSIKEFNKTNKYGIEVDASSIIENATDYYS